MFGLVVPFFFICVFVIVVGVVVTLARGGSVRSHPRRHRPGPSLPYQMSDPGFANPPQSPDGHHGHHGHHHGGGHHHHDGGGHHH